MNTPSPEESIPTFVEKLHQESDRFEVSGQAPERDISLPFAAYVRELALYAAPSAEEIAREVAELAEYLQGVGHLKTAFIVPVFFPAPYDEVGAEARLALYHFDEDGYSAEGPFNRQGYYLKVFPEEIAAGSVDIRGERERAGELAEMIALRVKGAAMALREQVWRG